MSPAPGEPPCGHEGRWVLTRDGSMYVCIDCGAATVKDAYLIWSHEHAAWWRPSRAGYTRHLSAAGRYPRQEALAICRDARGGWLPGEPPPEIPVREEDALAMEPSGERKAAAMFGPSHR